MSSRSATGPSRRNVLLAAPAAVLLAACTDGAPAPEPEPPPPVDPDVALRTAAAQRERALLQAYDDAVRALPGLAARLLPVREHHRVHLAALEGAASGATASPPDAVPASPPPAPVAPPSGAPVAPPAVPPPAVPAPATATAALAGLSAQERAAGDAHAQAALSASRQLAGVLASLSASELSHPLVLR